MSREAKVGLFVSIGLILLFLLSTQVNRFQGFGKKGYEVTAFLDDASGLEEHAVVKMKGVKVGYVKRIALADGKVALTLFLFDRVKIPSDSAVTLAKESMLGSKYVNIVPGKTTRYLMSEGKITKQVHIPSFEEMGAQVAYAAEEIKAFVHELRETLDETNRKRLQETFANLEALTRDLREVTSANKARISDLIAHIDEAAQKFGDMSAKFSQSADTINGELPDLMAKLRVTLDRYKSVGEKLDRHIPVLAERYEKVGKNLNDILEENRQPLNKALTSFNDFFTDGRHIMSKLGTYIDSVTQTKLILGMDGFYMADDGNFKGGLHIDYMPYYTRHYMVDILSAPDYTERSVDGSFPGDEEHQKGKWRVSAQIGKRYRDFMIRGGIIENTAGAGLDWYMMHNKLKLSLEAFDFNAVNDIRGDNIHMRTMARYRFYKHINAYVGYDNFLNSEADNIFFGLGIRFEDDRMKYLLGAGASAAGSAK